MTTIKYHKQQVEPSLEKIIAKLPSLSNYRKQDKIPGKSQKQPRISKLFGKR